jgi:hypothetical protein
MNGIKMELDVDMSLFDNILKMFLVFIKNVVWTTMVPFRRARTNTPDIARPELLVVVALDLEESPTYLAAWKV